MSRGRLLLRRLVVVVAWTSLLYIGYQLTNRHQLVPPRELPLTPIDRLIPFWPWTVLPYFVLIGGMYLPAAIVDGALFRRTLVALTIATLVNYTVFVLWPTVYPRPAPPDGAGLGDALYRWLTTIDTPANCFPSGHITAPTIGGWAVTREQRRWRWPLRLAFIPFALSILTTKQHYAVDLLGGLATAILGIVVSGLLCRPQAAAAPAGVSG
jgi:membrane-associated phospholipid phosphatase